MLASRVWPGVRCGARAKSDAAAGGFWQLWAEQERERRARWDEACEERTAHRDAERVEWERMRREWADLTRQRADEEAGSREAPLRDKSRVTWWWEDTAKGTRRATAEDIRAFERHFAGRSSAASGRASSAPLSSPSDTLGHYAALGLVTASERRSSAAAVRAAFERTAKASHPDTAQRAGRSAGEQATRFRRAKEAYDVLRDPERRARYDSG